MTLSTLGIDIAKLKFNVCLINPSGTLRHKVFPNTATGFEQLREWLAKQGIECVHACLEATGTRRAKRSHSFSIRRITP
jgi:hypothetical protein